MATARKPTLRGRQLARALWQIVRIYWTSPDAKWGGLLLGGAVALEFGAVQTSLYVADSQRRAVEALEGRDASAFLFTIGLFVGLSLLFVIVSALRIYLRQLLEIRWRRGLTGDYLGRWIGGHAYGQTQLHGGAIDNPDQRIAEDIRDFVASALGLSLSLLASVATLISFGGLLVEPVERMADPDRRRRAAAGAGAPPVGGDRVLDRLDVAHAPARPPPRADQLRPLPLRGGLPLRPGPLPRPRRGGGAQRGAKPSSGSGRSIASAAWSTSSSSWSARSSSSASSPGRSVA